MKAAFYLGPAPSWTLPLSSDPWLMTIGGRPLIDHWFYAAWEIGVRQVLLSGEGCTSGTRKYLAGAESRWGVKVAFEDSPLAVLIRLNDGPLIVFDDYNLPWLSQGDASAPSRSDRPVLRWSADEDTMVVRPVEGCNMISLASPIAYWEINVALARRSDELANRLPATDCRVANGTILNPETIFGSHCRIARGAVIGEGVVLGSRVVVDEGASIRNSVILDGTYIGPNLDVSGRIVAGEVVLDPDTGAIARFQESWLFAKIA